MNGEDKRSLLEHAEGCHVTQRLTRGKVRMLALRILGSEDDIDECLPRALRLRSEVLDQEQGCVLDDVDIQLLTPQLRLPDVVRLHR